MTHEANFLRDILENPGDDTPRLIYADWLDERGDPRGMFIRVQCALARVPDDDPCRAELMRREKSLLRLHKKTWVEPLRGFAKWPFVFGTRPYSGGRRPGRRHVETAFAGSVPALCPLCKVPLKNSLEKHLTLGCNALS